MSRLIDKLYNDENAEQTIVSVFHSIQKSESNNFDVALEKLNSNFNKGLIGEDIYEKALGELDDLIEKAFQHKYIKRTGTKGNYKYWYKEGKKNGSHLSVGDIYEHSGGKAKIEDIYTDEEDGVKMVDYKFIGKTDYGTHITTHETQTLNGFLRNYGKKLGEGGKESKSGEETKTIDQADQKTKDLIKQAHKNLTKFKPEYSPNSKEIQDEINRIQSGKQEQKKLGTPEHYEKWFDDMERPNKYSDEENLKKYQKEYKISDEEIKQLKKQIT